LKGGAATIGSKALRLWQSVQRQATRRSVRVL
jgi:hypothetical protein